MNKIRIDIGRGVIVRDDTTRVVLRLAEYCWKTRQKSLSSLERIETEMRPAEFIGKAKNKRIERIKSVYIFFQAFSQRSGKSSRLIFRNLYAWWQSNPELFDPLLHPEKNSLFAKFVREVDPQAEKSNDFRELLWWMEVVSVLQKYGGSALEYFYQMRETGDIPLIDQVMAADMESWEEVSALRDRILKQLQLFTGVKVKVASMFMIFFQETTWRENPEFWQRLRKIPFIPVDLHHIRLSWMLGITDVFDAENIRVREAHRDMVGPVLSHYLSQVCFEEGIDHASVSQSIYNTGAVIHAKWNRAKADKHRQWQICTEECPFHLACTHVVSPDKNLASKKKNKASISRRIRHVRAVEAYAAGNNLSFDDLPQPPLFTDHLPTVEELLVAKGSLQPDTQNRGAICNNVAVRGNPIYGNSLWENPDTEILQFLDALQESRPELRECIQDMLKPDVIETLSVLYSQKNPS